MKALSFTQPWAQAVVLGRKQYETRSWRTNYQGWLAIHASKGFPKWARLLCGEYPFLDSINTPPNELTTGAIIGIVQLYGCERTEDILATRDIPQMEIALGDWSPGRYAWILGAAKWTGRGFPCQGSLGLWDVPEQMERVLQEYLPPEAVA